MFGATSADFYCFSELWITNPNNFEKFKIEDYINFGNYRPSKSGIGVVRLFNPCMRHVLTSLSCSISPSNGYNICSIKQQNCSPKATLASLYRPPNASAKVLHISYKLHLNIAVSLNI